MSATLPVDPIALTRRQMLGRLGCLAALSLTGESVAAFLPPNGVEEAAQPGTLQKDADQIVLQRLTLREQHLRLIQVSLQDQTDIHNELVHTREWLLHPAEPVDLRGNLFILEHVPSGTGRIIIKFEPLPHARHHPIPVDLRIVPRADTGFDLTLYGSAGLGAPDSDSFVVLAYAGGLVGRTRALQQCQRARRPASLAHRLPRFLSNTWGDRSKDSRIRSTFIEKEIAAAARLGVEVVQIDDGWQRGITKNSARAQQGGIWEGFWQTRPDFWEPDPDKFPDGLDRLTSLAAAKGMELGLWFAPDSVHDFSHWEKDAECLIALNRKFGIRHFKIDGVHAPTAAAQVNLSKFFSRVLRDTQDAVVFDLDVTASLRPGYFGAVGTGPLFVENRYTDWHRYWPHQTLRNLWQLAWWIDPGRLRMEFLNHSRNTEKYPDDPLAPQCYAPAALFATVFFSNPLGWFEVSELPRTYQEQLPPLVSLWKALRGEIFTGTIIPLGQAPDGLAWTGFASLQDDGRTALALLYRELNPASSHSLPVPGFGPATNVACKVLAGEGQAAWEKSALKVTVPETLGWVLVRLSAGPVAPGGVSL